MLQETVKRASPLVPPERVFVVTSYRHAGEVRSQLPTVPPKNILQEPVGRNSGPAVGLAAAHIHKHDPDAVALMVSADHVILNQEMFLKACHAAEAAANSGYLATIGIRPSGPETRYGYMELGEVLMRAQELNVHKALRFTEKPNVETARKYLATGNYVWNGGIFVWKTKTVLDEIRRYMPELSAALDEIASVIGTPSERSTLARVWSSVTPISIDYGILECSQQVVTVPADLGWSDIGDWSALASFGTQDIDGNVLSGDVALLDTHDSLLYSSGRLIAAIGLQDMIIVETDDVLLICPKERAQDVRNLVQYLRERGHGDKL